MRRTAFLLPGLFCIMIIVSKKLYAQTGSAYHCKYKMQIKDMLTKGSPEIGLSSNILVEYDVTTNGEWYLICPKLISTIIGTSDVSDLAENKTDSILINKRTKVAYLLLNGEYAHLVTKKIGTSIQGTAAPLMIQDADSTKFFMDMKYDSIISPFPQYIGNSNGIVKIEKGNIICELISVTKIMFDFKPYIINLKKFIKRNESLELPF